MLKGNCLCPKMHLTMPKYYDTFPCHYTRMPRVTLLSFLRAFAHAVRVPWNALLSPLLLINASHSLAQLHFPGKCS